ncbi:MAG: NAD(P)-dependent oxidoreductase [Actinomycetota bacterium]|nr:NAD(P)-dependent oxidoreductase [Actinomycetota bacterium]
MTSLAVCGLGQMGVPVATRLLEAGHDVVVWNRTAERARALVEHGAEQAASPAEAAAGAEVVLTMLATPAALEEVTFGQAGLAAGLADGSTLIEMSTVGPGAVRALAGRLPGGVRVLDAPVLGSVAQATDGTLKVFVGGDGEVFESWRPVLEQLGRPVRFGPLGAGAAMKLVANSVLGVLMTGLGEALALADALGLDQAQVLDALAESPIGATVKSKRSNLESGAYSPNFKLALALKDLGLVTEAAGSAGVDLRLAPAAQTWFQEAADADMGELDYSAVIAHLRGARP